MQVPATLSDVGDARTQRRLQRLYATSHSDVLGRWEEVIVQCEKLGTKTPAQRQGFVKLLKEAVAFLKNDPDTLQRYAADPRLLTVFLRLADHDSHNAYTYFRDMERNRLCQDLALFHIAKSNVYERNEDYAIAGTILKEAIKKNIQPVGQLKKMYAQCKRRIKSRERKRAQAEKARKKKAKQEKAQREEQAKAQAQAEEQARARAQAQAQAQARPQAAPVIDIFTDENTTEAASSHNEGLGFEIQTDEASKQFPAEEAQEDAVPQVKNFNCDDFWGTTDEGAATTGAAAGSVAATQPTPKLMVNVRHELGTPATDDSDLTMNAQEALEKIGQVLWQDMGDDDDDDDEEDGGARWPGQPQMTNENENENENANGNFAIYSDRSQQLPQVQSENAVGDSSTTKQTQPRRRGLVLQARSTQANSVMPWEESGKKRGTVQQLDTPVMQSSLQMSAIVPDTEAEIPIYFAEDSEIIGETPQPQRRPQAVQHEPKDAGNDDFAVYTENSQNDIDDSVDRKGRRQTASPSALRQFMCCLDDSDQSEDESPQKSASFGHRIRSGFGGGLGASMDSSENLMDAIIEGREESISSAESGDYMHSDHSRCSIRRMNTL